MQQYEYKYESVEWTGEPRNTANDVLNKLGSEGWQIISWERRQTQMGVERGVTIKEGKALMMRPKEG